MVFPSVPCRLIYQDSRAPLLCFCCRGDRVVPYGICSQVHLLTLSYYLGLFVTIEQHPESLNIFSSALGLLWDLIHTRSTGCPQGWATTSWNQRDESRPIIKIKTSCVNIFYLSRLSCVRDSSPGMWLSQCLVYFMVTSLFFKSGNISHKLIENNTICPCHVPHDLIINYLSLSRAPVSKTVK